MNLGLRNRHISSDAVPAIRIGPEAEPISCVRASRAERVADELEPDAQRALDQHEVALAGAARARSPPPRRRRRPAAPRRRTLGDRGGQRPDRHQQVDPGLVGQLARARRGRHASVGPELEHVAEHGDAPRGAGARGGRGEVAEGGAHRHRVGVVAAIDDRDPSGQRDALAPPGDSASSTRPAGRHPDRPGGGDRGEQVGPQMGLPEGDLELDPLALRQSITTRSSSS